MPDDPSPHEPLARTLYARGAVLFLIGLFTGIYAGFAQTGQIALEGFGPMLALASHLNGLFGGLWLVAVGATMRASSLGEAGKRWLARLVTLVTYANWGVTLIA